LSKMNLLAKELISDEYKIFTYSAILLQLDRELLRAKRHKNDLFVILLKIFRRNTRGTDSPLPRSILQKFMKRIADNLRKADALGFFWDGSFIILAGNNSVEAINNITDKVNDVVFETNQKEYLVEPASLAVETNVLAARRNDKNPSFIDLVVPL
jgi:PleD family two-component response regulator